MNHIQYTSMARQSHRLFNLNIKLIVSKKNTHTHKDIVNVGVYASCLHYYQVTTIVFKNTHIYAN